MKTLSELRRLVLRDKVSIRQDSRTLGVARNNATRWLQEPEVAEPRYPTRRLLPGILDALKEQLSTWLKADSYRNKRKLLRSLKTLLKQRQSVKPIIGRMKSDGLLDKNWHKGALVDTMHAVLCGVGHNLRMILRCLRELYCTWMKLMALALMAVSGIDWQAERSRTASRKTSYQAD